MRRDTKRGTLITLSAMAVLIEFVALLPENFQRGCYVALATIPLWLVGAVWVATRRETGE